MKKFRLYLAYQKYLFPYLTKGVISFLASDVYLLLGMATPLITKALLDYAYPNRDVSLLTLFIGIQIAIFFLQQYFGSISGYLDMYMDNALTVSLKEKFFATLQRLSLKFHNEKKVGDLIFRLDKDISSTVTMVTQVIAVSLQTLLQLVFLLFICFKFDWRLTLVALSGIPIYFIETHFFAGKRRDILQKELEMQSGVESYLQERLPAIKMIKSFGREGLESGLFKRKIQELFLITRQSYIVSFLNRFTDSAISSIWLAILGWYAGYHVITGVLSIGELLAVTAYVAQIYGPVMQVGDIYKFIIEGMVSIGRVDEVMAQVPSVQDAPDAQDLKDVNGNINFKDVSFSYFDGQPVLNNINVEIKAGKAIALVGPSGAGKTTFTDLMMRFYDPDKGRISMGGLDLKKITQASLRQRVTIVNQEVTIFAGSVADNIKYGNESVGINDIINAAKMANAHEFIEKLEAGYDTLLEERGSNLSGGQRQRVTIARALLRDPKLLMLDEATSALDPESEASIHDALANFRQGRTLISIAHKLSTIIDSDEILFFEKGSIVERGSFNQLMAAKGRFYEFFEKEFENFRYFSDRLGQEVLRTKRYNRPFSMIMLGLRDLGKIAGEIGEEELDAAILDVEELIRKNKREVDFSCKYHKDRFLVGLPEINLEKANLAAKRLSKSISENKFLKGNQEINFLVDWGVSSIGEDAANITELYRNCEKMLEGSPR